MSNTKQEPFYILLKQKREKQKIELNEIAERTKINPKFLKSFEQGDFENLPIVYTRLFLRSYAIEIGVDPNQVLENYEIFTTGEIQPKIDQTIITEEKAETFVEKEENIFDPDFLAQFDQKKLIAVISAFIILFVLASWVRNLSQSTLDNGNNTILNQTENIDKSSSINPDSFLSNNIKLAEKTINLGIESPFKLEVESEFDSKINVKIIENKITTYERISSLPAGRKRSWDSIGTLQFELSSVQGINVTLNGNDRIISQFLKPDNISEEDVSIRVILKEDGYLTTVYFGIN